MHKSKSKTKPPSSRELGSMTVEQKAALWIGQPVGLSLRNGQGVSGVLCGIQSGQLFIMQYLYHSQFATFHYTFDSVADIFPFPPCQQ